MSPVRACVVTSSGFAQVYTGPGNDRVMTSDGRTYIETGEGNDVVNAIGSFIPGIPVPTPIFIVIICGIIFALLFRFTTLSLMTQAVGINQRAARLNGMRKAS